MNNFPISLCTLLVCYGIVRCDPEKANLIYQECAEQNQVPDNELEELRLHPDNEPSENVKCLVKCMIVKLGFIKDNVFDVEYTMKWSQDNGFDIPKTQSAIDECGTHFQGDGSCGDVYQLNKCLNMHYME